MVIRRGVPGGAALADLLDDPSWVTGMNAADGFWHLWSALPQFVDAATDPLRGTDRAAWSSLAQVLGRLGERDPDATLADYLRWSESEDFEATPLLEFRAGETDRLALTTLHQAKGLGWDLVIIADAREGVFPDLRTRESLLGSRHLSRSQPEDPAAYAAIPPPGGDAPGVHGDVPGHDPGGVDLHHHRLRRRQGGAQPVPVDGERPRQSPALVARCARGPRPRRWKPRPGYGAWCGTPPSRDRAAWRLSAT